MKVKLDENMPRAMVKLLEEAHHDVSTVTDEALGGASDREVIGKATAESRILLTFDVAFGNIRLYPLGRHAGVVVFRLRDQRWAALEGPARRFVASATLERLSGGLAIVDEYRLRVRVRPGRKPEP